MRPVLVFFLSFSRSLFRYSSWLSGVWMEFFTSIQWDKSPEENRISVILNRELLQIVMMNYVSSFESLLSRVIQWRSHPVPPGHPSGLRSTTPDPSSNTGRGSPSTHEKEDPLSFTRETRVREPLKRKTRARISSKSENFVDLRLRRINRKSLSDFKDWIKKERGKDNQFLDCSLSQALCFVYLHDTSIYIYDETYLPSWNETKYTEIPSRFLIESYLETFLEIPMFMQRTPTAKKKKTNNRKGRYNVRSTISNM